VKASASSWAQADRGLLGKRVIVLPTYTYGTWAEKVVVPQDKVGDTAAALVGALRFGGTIVTYGSLGGGPSQLSNAALLTREVRHTGFWLLTWLSRAPRSEIVDA
jgi:NADPH:quinone reductase-like Zn-dependent oxidoreductase